MKSIKCFIILICCCTMLKAQSPTLVVDFNMDEESSFNQLNFNGIEFGNHLIFPIVSNEFGEELGVLNNGELSVLKDLNEGMVASKPNNFVQFDNKVYFSAFDDTNGGCIWSTDGTEENTQISFSFGLVANVRPQGLITSESGWLYYTYDGVLYRTDGSLNENLFTGVDFFTAPEQQSNNYTQYNNEIAFIIEDNNSVKLYTIEAGSVVLLATSDQVSVFTEIFGLSEVSEGLIFGIDDSFNDDVTGTYSYNAQNNNLNQVTIANSNARRLHKFTDEASLAWIGGNGYYMTNGIQGEEELLFGSSNSSFTQGQEVVHAVDENKMIFHTSDGLFGDDFIHYTDGTSSGTSQLFEVNQYLSNTMVYENYVFLASGTSNGHNPELYYINMNDGSFNNFFSSSQSSNSTNSILFLGVQDGKLYYISNLDASIGRELYSIDLDILTATSPESLEENKVFVQQINTSYRVVTEGFVDIEVYIYTVDGKLLRSDNIITNTDYELPPCNGMCFLSFQFGDQIKVHKFLMIDE